MTHIMVDLETFSTSPHAAIVQIGACAFELDPEPRVSLNNFEITVSLQSSLLAGLWIDPETIDWWRKQSDVAREAITRDPVQLGEALISFGLWFASFETTAKRSESKTLIWSHGAAFDIAVLENSYLACLCAPPWYYRNVRDTRTLFALATNLTGWKKPHQTVAHTARADACAQANDVCAAYAALRAIKPNGIGV